MTKIEFSHLLTIYRASNFAADGKSASVHIENAAVRDALRIALHDDNFEDAGITVDSNPDDIKVGDVIGIQIQVPKISLGYLALDFDTLLSMRRATFLEPKNYYLIKERYSKADSAPPFSVTRYRKVLQLVKLLREGAAYLDKDRDELVFIKSGKYSIPIEYTPGELAVADVDAIDKIIGLFSAEDDAHKEQKLAVLTTAVLSLLEGVTVGRRFRKLLIDLPELSNKFADGYKIYLANFSYDKVRDELQAWKVELLGIPIATVVVATQLKLAGENDKAIFLANVAVVIGCWIFSALFLLLCRNQAKTLEVLEVEINRQEEKMKADYEPVLTMFKEVFTSLRGRVADQKRVLTGVRVILGIGFVVAHYFWWQLTKGYLFP
jgi:hypothetical protein